MLSDSTSYPCAVYVWIRRPSGIAGATAAAAAAADLVMVLEDDEPGRMAVLGCGLYSRIDRSADPVSMYVPGDAEYVRACTGPCFMVLAFRLFVFFFFLSIQG